MRDPEEGVAPDGTIRTGVSRARIPPAFLLVIDAVQASIAHRRAEASLYLCGSVATGQAVIGRSDVDLIALDLPARDADAMAAALSERFAGVCREVAVGAGSTAALHDEGDEAYGNRAFLRARSTRHWPTTWPNWRSGSTAPPTLSGWRTT